MCLSKRQLKYCIFQGQMKLLTPRKGSKIIIKSNKSDKCTRTLFNNEEKGNGIKNFYNFFFFQF